MARAYDCHDGSVPSDVSALAIAVYLAVGVFAAWVVASNAARLGRIRRRPGAALPYLYSAASVLVVGVVLMALRSPTGRWVLLAGIVFAAYALYRALRLRRWNRERRGAA